MKTTVKVSQELAEILQEASKEVETWPQWQRSLDPQGSKADATSDESKSDRSGRDVSRRKESAA